MEDYLGKVMPFVDKARSLFMSAAEFIGRTADLEATNVYFFLILAVSIWSSKKILEFFYTTLDGRKIYWAILAGIIFWVFKYL